MTDQGCERPSGRALKFTPERHQPPHRALIGHIAAYVWEFCARRECLVAATDAGNGWVEVRLNGRGEIVVSVYEPGMLTLWTAMLPEGVREARRRCPACDRFLDREGNGHLAGCPEDACLALPLEEGTR